MDPVLGTVQFILHSKHTKPLPTFKHKFCINHKHIRHLIKTQDPHDIYFILYIVNRVGK